MSQPQLPPQPQPQLHRFSASSHPAPAFHRRIWRVNGLAFSGMVDDQHPGFNDLFVRPWTQKTINYLNKQYLDFQNLDPNNPVMPMAEIFGASGAGKSSVVWGWLTELEVRKRMWIHNDSSTEPKYTIVRMITTGVRVFKTVWSHKIVRTLNAVIRTIEKVRPTIIVIDGTFNESGIDAIAAQIYQLRAFGVHCTSSQSDRMKTVRATRFTFGQNEIIEGWTKDEYINAENTLAAANGVPPHTIDAIEEMYYYAGGSARYYFVFFQRINDLIKLLDDMISNVPHTADFFAGGMRSGEAHVRNSIMTYRSTRSVRKPVFVSKYVIRELARDVNEEFIQAAANILPDNGSWQGWVTELDFLHVVRKQRKIISILF